MAGIFRSPFQERENILRTHEERTRGLDIEDIMHNVPDALITATFYAVEAAGEIHNYDGFFNRTVDQYPDELRALVERARHHMRVCSRIELTVASGSHDVIRAFDVSAYMLTELGLSPMFRRMAQDKNQFQPTQVMHAYDTAVRCGMLCVTDVETDEMGGYSGTALLAESRNAEHLCIECGRRLSPFEDHEESLCWRCAYVTLALTGYTEICNLGFGQVDDHWMRKASVVGYAQTFREMGEQTWENECYRLLDMADSEDAIKLGDAIATAMQEIGIARSRALHAR